MTTELVFGPVPSRRLGRSLGVNHVPRKHCSYSCVYCQVGRTTTLELERVAFHPPEQVIEAIVRRVAACRARGEPVDYVTFVPDGEPTLDLHLGAILRAIEPLGVRRAVLTNGSLLWRDDVRAELAAADLVSIKVDAVEDRAWRRVDRPSGALALEVALDGIRRFAAERRGGLLTETMLVRGLNDSPAVVEGVAAFLETLRPDVAYLAVPTRPPAEPDVDAPCEATLVAAFETLAARLPRVELLTGDESGPFGRSGDPVTDLLAILAVHPMQEPAARRYLAEGGGRPGLEALLANGQVVRVSHRGRPFVTLGLTPVRALATARTP
jgi:wyosine [tRNA(Phe)-imidazoG37] synthetase (radical SAM superfamily)